MSIMPYNLQNKRILMFYPYGATKHYGDAIKNELIQRGAEVQGYDERPSQKSLIKICIRLFKKKIPQIFSKYINHIISENRDKQFDYILVFRGEAFTKLSIRLLRDKYKDAKFILYLWDILDTTNVRDIVPLFDRALSFDPADASSINCLKFRPTFCVPAYEKVGTSINAHNDLMFVGTLHSKRHSTIQLIQKYFKIQGLRTYVYLYVPSILVYIKDFICKFPYIGIEKVHFSPLSLDQTVEILSDCKCILDINYSTQKSLSMRAYEALISHRKFITTNSEIKKYDFYNKNNIYIIDITKPFIPQKFIDTPFETIDSSIVYKYTIKGFVDDLFDLEEPHFFR